VPRQTLRRHVAALRQELVSQDKLDGRTRELLERIATDVEDVIDENAEESASPRERIESAATEFEAEHPTLARILREVGDTLAKLGV
jgi:uncharacterized membrane protein YccC